MSSGTQTSAAAKAEAAFFEELDEATAANVKYSKYYAGAMIGLVALFAFVHWMQIVFSKYGSRTNPGAESIIFVSTPIRRLLKGIVIGEVLILPGRILLAIVYFGINIALMFPQLDWSNQVFLAKRCGWSVDLLRTGSTVLTKLPG